MDQLSPKPGSNWPMPVDEFLKGGHLQRADVVLTRKHRDFRSWIIRWATGGSFSHAAMVFLTPHHEQGFDNSFVIEAVDSGVDLTNLADYLNDRRSVVGIRRLNQPWFNQQLQSRVRGRMLNSIKSRYSYATIFEFAWNFINQTGYGIRSAIVGPRRAIQGRRDLAMQPPNEFICSGLVQLGFLHTVVEAAEQGYLPPDKLSQVLFRDDLARFLPEDWEQFTPAEQFEIMWDFTGGFRDELEAVTPEDLAATPRLEWVFVVRAGMVHSVRSEAEAKQLLDWRPTRKP